MKTLTALLFFLIIGCSKTAEQPQPQNKQSRIDLVVSGDMAFVVHAVGNDLVEFYDGNILLRLPEILLFTMVGANQGDFSVYPVQDIPDKQIYVTSDFEGYSTFNTRDIQVNVLHVGNPSRINDLTLYNNMGDCIEINGTFYYSGQFEQINF